MTKHKYFSLIFFLMCLLFFSLNVKADINNPSVPAIPAVATIPPIPTIPPFPTAFITIKLKPCPCTSPTTGPSPIPTTAPTQTPVPTVTPTPTPGPTDTPVPTATPTPGSNNGGGGGGSSSSPSSNQPNTVSSSPQVLSSETNYNPLVVGIMNSFGEVLGLSTQQLPSTGGETIDSASLYPSGNTLINDSYLSIPKLGLNKPLYHGQSIDGALLIGSGEVLEIGDVANTIFYGHYTDDVFGRLTYLAPGDLVSYDKNGESYRYAVTAIMRVPFDYTKIYHYNNPDQIILITCDKTDPQLRVVVIAMKK